VIAAGGLDVELRGQLRSARESVSAHLPALRNVSASAGIEKLIRSYQAAFDSHLALLERHAFVKSQAVHEDAVDPLFHHLSERLAEVSDNQAAKAATAFRRATVGTSASLAIAVLLILLLFWRFQHDRHQLLRKLSKQALQDPLTGLPNRRKLMVDLEQATAKATLADPRRLVMFDLDGFKIYNDTFGHPEGDLLLGRLAARFAAAVDGHGSAYRLGGDEFCALIPGVGQVVDDVIRDCRTALAESGAAFTIRASCGTASIPAQAHTASQALHLADQRMYSDKDSEPLRTRQARRSALLARTPADGYAM